MPQPIQHPGNVGFGVVLVGQPLEEVEDHVRPFGTHGDEQRFRLRARPQARALKPAAAR